MRNIWNVRHISTQVKGTRSHYSYNKNTLELQSEDFSHISDDTRILQFAFFEIKLFILSISFKTICSHIIMRHSQRNKAIFVTADYVDGYGLCQRTCIKLENGQAKKSSFFRHQFQTFLICDGIPKILLFVLKSIYLTIKKMLANILCFIEKII